MMSAFFSLSANFKQIVSQLYKVILILDKFFLKYGGVVKMTTPHTPPTPQKKLPSKSPALLGLRLDTARKPYFPSPGISQKAQKDQVNIVFTSTFLLKKDQISHLQKVSNKNFSVISKYHLSINFLAQHATFVNIKEISFCQFPALKKISFYSQKSIISTFSSSKKFII